MCSLHNWLRFFLAELRPEGSIRNQRMLAKWRSVTPVLKSELEYRDPQQIYDGGDLDAWRLRRVLGGDWAHSHHLDYEARSWRLLMSISDAEDRHFRNLAD
jgi:hypothetical protein